MRAVRLLIAGLVLGALAVTFTASAQSVAPSIPDEVVRKMLDLGLQNIQRALCDGFNQCTPATPDEFQNPPITLDQARGAIFVGGQSAVARWCGFDADRRSVAPLMRRLRLSKQYSERQVALIAVIHGIQQSIVAEQLQTKGTCDAATRSLVDAQLPKS